MAGVERSMNSFGSQSALTVGDRDHEFFRLDHLEDDFGVSRLPFSFEDPVGEPLAP